MAEDNKFKSAEDIEKELSVGKFAGQQALTIGMTLGGAALGIGAGLVAARSGLSNMIKNSKWITNFLKNKDSDKVSVIKEMITPAITAASGIVGLIVGSTASMYGHWRKVEGEHLAVQEINKDVANLMEKRVQFENTLDQQSKVVEKILKEHSQMPQSAQDKLIQRDASPTETARG